MKQSSTNKNTIYNVIKSISAIIFPFITFPYISRVLGAENVGKLNFGNSIVSYFSLIASLGVATYAIRECSKLKKQKKELEVVASQIFTLNMLTTAFSYGCLLITLLFVKNLHEYRALICIQSTAIVFTTIGADWINTTFEDFRYVTIRTVSMQVLSVVLMFILIHDPDDYMKYALISVVASSGANLINVFYRKRFCKIRFVRRIEIKKHIKPILLLFSLILAQTIYCNSDITMLGIMKGDHEVGLYSTSVKIYNIVNTMVASVTWVVMPKLSLAFAEKNYNDVNKNLRYALSFIMTLGIPCIVGMNVITPQLIECMAGPEYLGAVWSMRILTISLLASFISGFIGNLMMLPSGREKICLRAAIISMGVNVALNMVLIPLFGLNAAAATTATAEIVGIVVKLPYIEKEIKIERLKDILLGPIVGGVGIVVIATIIQILSDNVWIICGGTIILSVIFYAIILISMKNEFVLSFIGGKIKRK